MYAKSLQNRTNLQYKALGASQLLKVPERKAFLIISVQSIANFKEFLWTAVIFQQESAAPHSH